MEGTEMIASYEQQMMTEALDEHDKGCCTKDSPCTLRRGITKVLESKKLTPDVRGTENAPLRTGTGRGTARKVVQPTGPQAALWSKLMDQIEDALGAEQAERLRILWAAVKVFKDYSSLIDVAMTLVRETKKVAAAKALAQNIAPGMYLRDGKVYKVVTSQAGRPYAKVLNGTTFEYAPGALKTLDATHRMSLEDAKKFGRETGTCCSCGRELTNPESIEAGIGPICAQKF